MSYFDYEQGRLIEAQGYSFYALIQAAMRQADTGNTELLKQAFPDVHAELIARYTSPGGILPGDEPSRSTVDAVVADANRVAAAAEKVAAAPLSTNLVERGKRIAERHLIARGMTVLDRDWQGSIDLVLRDGDETVFVPVSTRENTTYGHPLEAFTAAKLTRMRRLAATWCEAHPGAGRIRIDVVAVVAPLRAPATVEHLEQVF